MARNQATAVEADAPEDAEDIESTADDGEDSEDSENGEGKKRTRVAMPFGRPFNLTVKFHNDLNGERDRIVSDLLTVISNANDGETLDVHRSTRGEPNPDIQTWLIAPQGYDWPESSTKERGVRIPQGALADALRKFAAKNDVSMEKAAEMFAAAFDLDSLPTAAEK